MLQKVSPEPMENSSGYVSNTNSMKPPPVKYATVGRNRPGAVKRTSSLVVTQPVVPPAVYKAPPRQRELRKHYKNDLSRPSSQASRSSGGSGAGRRPSSRNSREGASDRLTRQRAGSSRRSSYSKVRRPESRASSKALILRRRESSRREAPQRSASIRSGREAREARPDSRASQASQRPAVKPSRSIFGSWKPRITLRRSKSLQVKPEPTKKREIRFGDEYEPRSVIMMKGVEHRRADAGARSMSTRTDPQLSSRREEGAGRRSTQTLNRPAKRSSPPSRSERASSAEATRRLEPLGETPQEGSPRTRRYRQHEKVSRAPSELSSSSPRAPVWRADSDASLSDTMTAQSRGSARHGDKYAARSQRSRGRNSESSGERKSAGVMGFLRRKFSMKPREKPSPAPVKKRERASSSSLSSLERPARHSKLKTAKSHEVLTVEPRLDELADERSAYRSLPRSQHRSGGGTTLSRRLSSLGWATVGRNAERSHSFRDEPRNNERRDLEYRAPKATNETTRGRPRPPTHEEPIQPIIQQRRALSQPSLFHPAEEREPLQEPFEHYANLPFQLTARHRSSPDLTEGLAAAPATRAVSQPSLVVAARSGRRSSESSSSQDSPDARRRSSRGRGPAHGGAHRKGILKRQRSSERQLDRRDEDGVKNVNVTRDVDKHGRQRQHGVLHGLAHNIKNVFRHRKGGDKQPAEGRAVVPSGDSVVSERFVNVTNTHEEHESGRREEEVHQLGSVSNEEVQRAIRDGVDARPLAQRQTAPGQVADPRAPQRRLLHQHGRSWRTVDTDDTHETSRHDRRGELLTESAHTHQHEEFHNVQVPDDGPDEEAREQVRSSSHSRRHTKDVDMLEHFSVPKGGRLADGIKLGDGLRYVQENVEEQREGDADLDGASGRVRDLHRLGFRPPGQTSTPIEYRPPEEKTKRTQTSSWLTNHFGSESGHSHSSEDEGRQRSAVKGRDEPDRRRDTSSYEYQQSSGTTQRGAAPPESWQRSEKYSREVRETPERTYIKESRESPRGGGYERVQVLPPGARLPPSSAISDLVSEVDEDPIFASKFSSGKRRSGGAGLTFSSVLREEPERRGRPPTQSPPTSPLAAAPPPAPQSPTAPSAPPRTKRKNRQQQQAPPPPPPPPPEPMRSYEVRHEVRRTPPRQLSAGERDTTPVRREVRRTPPRQLSAGERDTTPVRVETTQREDGRVVKEYHFRSSESPQRPVRRGSSAARESPPGPRDRSHSTDEPDGERPSWYSSSLTARLGGRHHQSSEQLDRRPVDPVFSTQTVDRRRPARHEPQPAFQTQTLPRKPREVREPPPPSRLGAASSRFGGSMINVSVRNNVLGQPPAPYSPARRSNSFFEEKQDAAGLKSPDIISAIQRTASVRRDEPTLGTRIREDVLRRNTENSSRSGSMEPPQRNIIPVTLESPPARTAPKVAPKVAPKPRPAGKDNFMRGLMRTAPELYSALHGDERKDSKTPSPKQSPPRTPPPPLHRARSPASPAPAPLDFGLIYPKTPPVFKRIERLRADEEVVTKEGRSRSSTPAEDVHNFRLGTMSPTGERTDVVKVQR